MAASFACFNDLPRASQPYPVAVIGDFLKDLDDEHALICLAGLAKLGYVDIVCVVGNMCPARLRARAAKGTLRELGLGHVPVGVGMLVRDNVAAGGSIDSRTPERAVPYIADDFAALPDGQSLLVRTLRACADRSLVLILQSALTDAAALVKNYPELVVQKVKHVAIMGGIRGDGDGDGDAPVPDEANNNTFDMDAASYLYATLWRLQIPMVVTTRAFAYEAKVPFKFYDALAAAHPVGRCLRDRQKPSLQDLWEQACAAPNSGRRGTLPDDRTRQWFVGVFCGGADPPIADGADVWPFVDRFVLYDPVNCFAAIPELRDHFMTPAATRRGPRLLLLGENGLRRRERFLRFLEEIELLGLGALTPAPAPAPPAPAIDAFEPQYVGWVAFLESACSAIVFMCLVILSFYLCFFA